ncbi:predicted protein [Naegleria gruberi]|uniref:Predicted protein n=1 Tax=Naegleria gruberi TaxID=5762 RepID=D2VSH5_NAEGR|nr:uncharacterized protein NAEGRDRAFT_71943 [Naegleria gruberi]EFC40194.1 predicted protein [Naegleria gruberi]|eukprot:XP_002672938.1 predicted protein [Naegleria gruberi strain NEG-M]
MSSILPLDLTSPLHIRLMLKEIECETLKQKVAALESHPLSNMKFEKWDDSLSSHNSILQQRFHHMLMYIQQLEMDIEARNRRIDMLEFSLNNKKKRRGGGGDGANSASASDAADLLTEQAEQLTRQRNLVKAFLKRKNQQEQRERFDSFRKREDLVSVSNSALMGGSKRPKTVVKRQ